MKVLILADNYREACELSGRYDLGPMDWRYVASERDIMGTTRPQVIAPSCYGRRSTTQVLGIFTALTVADARIAIVPCRVP